MGLVAAASILRAESAAADTSIFSSSDCFGPAGSAYILPEKIIFKLAEAYHLETLLFATGKPVDAAWKDLISGSYCTQYTCKAVDQKNIDGAIDTLKSLVSSGKADAAPVTTAQLDSMFPPVGQEPPAGAKILCSASASKKSEVVTVAGTDLGQYMTPLRIRGYADTIAISNQYYNGATDDLYETNQGVSLSNKDTGTTHSEQIAFTGAIGYDVLAGAHLNDVSSLFGLTQSKVIFGIVPYFGIDHETTKAPSKTSTPGTSSAGTTRVTQTSANQFDVGVAFTTYYEVDKTDSQNPFNRGLLVVRPDQLTDVYNDDRLNTLNARYVPLGKCGFNKLVRLWNYSPSGSTGSGAGASNIDSLACETDAKNQQPDTLDGMLLIDVRYSHGDYVYAGGTHTTDGLHDEDYDRLGGRVGGYLTWKGATNGLFKSYDLGEFYTDLEPIAGLQTRIEEVESTLSLDLTENKDASVTISYRNGRRQDTGARDEAWSIGLTAKY
jgi:hypothetical protein